MFTFIYETTYFKNPPLYSCLLLFMQRLYAAPVWASAAFLVLPSPYLGKHFLSERGVRRLKEDGVSWNSDTSH